MGVEQRRGHKSWHFQISFYQWYSRGDQRSPTAINIPININLRLGGKARIASDRNEAAKKRGAEGGKKISYAGDESHIGRSWELDDRKIHGEPNFQRG